MSGTATAQINLQAISHNLELVRSIAPNSRILALIKANAYGHGLLASAQTLLAADGFGVARLSEAVTLRDAGIVKPIVLLGGVVDAAELGKARELNLTPVINNDHQLVLLEKCASHQFERKLPVWLKLNTGMNRLGFAGANIESVKHRLEQCAGIELGVVMSHLACADDIANPATRKQIDYFNRHTDTWSVARSIAGSGGITGWPESHFDWVRPGIMLYGISPFPLDQEPQSQQVRQTLRKLKPAMTLKSRLIAVNKVAAGSPIGYSGRWICKRDSIVGVVGIGYGDGYSRQAQNGTPVLIDGKRYPLIGTVSMDMLTIDLSDRPESKPGDIVTLWGGGLPVEEVAVHMRTIAYELTTDLTNRVTYCYE